jgi:hypothetical protein
MSAPQVLFHYDGGAYSIALRPDLAPVTVGRLLGSLPATVDLHCAKIAGQHIFWHAPFVCEYEVATDILTLPPGTFLYWPERQFLELLYGTLQAEKARVTVLGALTGDIDWLIDLGRKLVRDHGQTVMLARLSAGEGTQSLARPEPACADSRLAWLRAAREAVWREEPTELRTLLARDGVMLPYGPLAMAEGEFRRLQELLWRLRGQDDAGPLVSFLLQAFIERIDGFCGLHDSGRVLLQARDLLQIPYVPVPEVVNELVLYCGRMAAWLDLHIPWNALNEDVRAALVRRGLRSGS